MALILGLLAFYVWIHGAIIVGTKVENTTTYEKILLITGLVFFVLILLGQMS